MARFALISASLLIGCVTGLLFARPFWVFDQFTYAWLRLAGARSKYVRLGNYRIHFFEGGKGRPLVLVHGLAGRAENWFRLIPPLIRRDHHVYALDLLGFGRSDHPDVDYSISLQTSILKRFFESQDLACADLGGWSMGGWVALKFALDFPGRVRRLFVADSAGIKFNLPFDPALFQVLTPQDARRLLFLLTSNSFLSRYLARDFVRRARAYRPVVQRTLKSMLGLTDLLDGKLCGIGVPVLIIWGKQDALIPVECAEAMHRQIPQSVVAILDGCGHLAPAECSGRMLREVGRFLDGEPPLPSSAPDC